MGLDPDPVGNGFVASLARPGGNITGLSTLSPEISGRQLEILKEIVPKLSTVAVLGSSTRPGNAQALKETELAAQTLGPAPIHRRNNFGRHRSCVPSRKKGPCGGTARVGRTDWQ